MRTYALKPAPPGKTYARHVSAALGFSSHGKDLLEKRLGKLGLTLEPGPRSRNGTQWVVDREKAMAALREANIKHPELALRQGEIQDLQRRQQQAQRKLEKAEEATKARAHAVDDQMELPLPAPASTPCPVNATRLPNGTTLSWEPNGVGGHRFISDEIGGGVVVWDTSIVARETLDAALRNHYALLHGVLATPA